MNVTCECQRKILSFMGKQEDEIILLSLGHRNRQETCMSAKSVYLNQTSSNF